MRGLGCGVGGHQIRVQLVHERRRVRHVDPGELRLVEPFPLADDGAEQVLTRGHLGRVRVRA